MPKLQELAAGFALSDIHNSRRGQRHEMSAATMTVHRAFPVLAGRNTVIRRARTSAIAGLDPLDTDDATSIGGKDTEIESGEHAENEQPCNKIPQPAGKGAGRFRVGKRNFDCWHIHVSRSGDCGNRYLGIVSWLCGFHLSGARQLTGKLNFRPPSKLSIPALGDELMTGRRSSARS